jgi:hypothetical protein
VLQLRAELAGRRAVDFMQFEEQVDELRDGRSCGRRDCYATPDSVDLIDLVVEPLPCGGLRREPGLPLAIAVLVVPACAP